MHAEVLFMAEDFNRILSYRLNNSTAAQHFNSTKCFVNEIPHYWEEGEALTPRLMPFHIIPITIKRHKRYHRRKIISMCIPWRDDSWKISTARVVSSNQSFKIQLIAKESFRKNCYNCVMHSEHSHMLQRWERLDMQKTYKSSTV